MSEGHGEAVKTYVETGEIKSNIIPAEYRDEEILA